MGQNVIKIAVTICNLTTALICDREMTMLWLG